MNKKIFIIVFLLYSGIVLSLKYIFHSPIGEFLIQIGYLVILIGLVYSVIRLIVNAVKGFLNKSAQEVLLLLDEHRL